ncbi:hypothetical protein RvY_01694 [Ramazzottius varieornatus]|uniref:Uncharacterized protein n=1 Tax=Ramazzottius varieornatus TaxID=947166 RepID=A0A1D1URX0_RAMVA|nr:hypothetical protein RvY_01694 [Ramazzottius varieornatus]
MSTKLQRKHPQSGAEQRENSREESAAEQTATEEARQTARAIKVMMGQVEACTTSLQETDGQPADGPLSTVKGSNHALAR